MNINRNEIENILKHDELAQRLLRAGWPESWLQINLPLGSTRALLVIEGGYADTPKRIADILKIGRTTVTGILDRLEAESLITRSIAPQDRRSFILTLTGKGRDLIHQIDEVRKKQLAAALSMMDDTSLEALDKGLEALVNALTTVYKSSREESTKRIDEDELEPKQPVTA